RNDFSVSFYGFLVNWLFFNIAAPSIQTTFALPIWPEWKGYFEPVLANYFSSPVSGTVATLFGVVLVASLLQGSRSKGNGDSAGLLLALLGYGVLRGLFFLIVNPGECLLFSSAVTLAHLLMISIAFAASGFPAKSPLLAALALLLLITNGGFTMCR